MAKHPDANIKINKFSAQKDGSFKLGGDLTIKGVTKPVNLTANVKQSNAKIDRVVADLEFDRTDFNVRYGSGKFFENLGDKMISDTVQVRVNLKLKQPIELGQN